MTDATPSDPMAALPPDDPRRTLTVADPESVEVPDLSVAGGTYSVLVSGEQSAGRYCLLDMYIPAGGGPPPHRHDFEEMFTLLEGELAFTFRGETSTVVAGSTVNIPANAPHSFENTSGKPVRMLCMCTPAGQEDFFAAIGDTVEGRTAPPLPLSEDDIAARRAKAQALAATYRTEFLRPGKPE